MTVKSCAILNWVKKICMTKKKEIILQEERVMDATYHSVQIKGLLKIRTENLSTALVTKKG